MLRPRRLDDKTPCASRPQSHPARGQVCLHRWVCQRWSCYSKGVTAPGTRGCCRDVHATPTPVSSSLSLLRSFACLDDFNPPKSPRKRVLYARYIPPKTKFQSVVGLASAAVSKGVTAGARAWPMVTSRASVARWLAAPSNSTPVPTHLLPPSPPPASPQAPQLRRRLACCRYEPPPYLRPCRDPNPNPNPEPDPNPKPNSYPNPNSNPNLTPSQVAPWTSCA